MLGEELVRGVEQFDPLDARAAVVGIGFVRPVREALLDDARGGVVIEGRDFAVAVRDLLEAPGEVVRGLVAIPALHPLNHLSYRNQSFGPGKLSSRVSPRDSIEKWKPGRLSALRLPPHRFERRLIPREDVRRVGVEQASNLSQDLTLLCLS